MIDRLLARRLDESPVRDGIGRGTRAAPHTIYG
jgi:hypothetical protein